MRTGSDINSEPQCRIEILESNNKAGKFGISGVLNFDSVTELNQTARDTFHKYSDIIIDLTGVTYVNSAGLALLLEWKRQAILDKKSFQLKGVPKKLLNIARISEIEEILSL